MKQISFAEAEFSRKKKVTRRERFLSEKAMEDGPLKAITVRMETIKAQVRSRVEHPFHVLKDLFGHRKVRYRGLEKNTAQLFTLFGLANLVLAKKQLLGA